MNENSKQSIEAFLQTSRRRFLQLTGSVALTASSAKSATSQGQSERVESILSDLSVEEKVGQMLQVNVESLDPAEVGHLFTEFHVGSVLTGGANPPTFDPNELRQSIDDLQRFAIANTDHGIPFAFGIDAVHGNVSVDGATAYPHNLGLGATRNPDLASKIGRETGKSVRAIGAHWNFAPDADLQRDPRWGRYYEGFSEDPFLTSEMVSSIVEGMQEMRNGIRVGATTKHFAGYSQPMNGNDRSPALIPLRELRQKVFPSFKSGIDAGSASIMVNSGSVNGVPAHASKELLTGILRDQWEYEGVVISDWDDFERMVNMHEYVPTFRDAVREGVTAGVDVYMEPDNPERFVTTLLDLVRTGEIPMARIDEAVRRVLRFKERLGLFTRPFHSEAEQAVGSNRELSEQAATESMTLLKNEGVLPLPQDVNSLLVTGPSADSVRNQMGGWTLGWQGLSKGIDAEPAATTVLDGIQDTVRSRATVTHIPTAHTFKPYGDDIWEFTNEDEIRSAAESSDAVVLVLGEGPYSEGFGNVNTIALPDAQRRLVDTVAETDTRSVGVLIAGRPRGTKTVIDQLDAVLMAYQPGTAAGSAVANVIFGETNPSGKLPFTWPQSTGQLVNVHNQRPPRAPSTSESHEPLYPFGHGLSYTEFEYSNLRLAPGKLPSHSERGSLTVTVTVTNTGNRDGTAVVHVFNTNGYGSVIRPDRRLMGFERVSLEAGQSKRVTIEASLSTLLTVPGDITGEKRGLVLEEGKYEITVGNLTETITVGTSGYTDWTPDSETGE